MGNSIPLTHHSLPIASNTIIKSIICKLLLTLSPNAFVDDMNTIHRDIGGSNICRLISIVQHNLCTWQHLLQTSGSTLNPPKCSWTPFYWTYNQLGHACLNTPPPDLQLNFFATDLEGPQHALQINHPSDAVQLLRVHIAANGNYKKLSVLQQKQQKYTQFLLCTLLTHCKAKVIYKQCYLPMVAWSNLEVQSCTNSERMQKHKATH